MAEGFFIFRVEGWAVIVTDGHAGVFGEIQGPAHAISQPRPLAGRRGFLGGDLDIIERKGKWIELGTFGPEITPSPDVKGEELVILECRLGFGISFALIPDHAPEGEGDNGGDFLVELESR